MMTTYQIIKAWIEDHFDHVEIEGAEAHHLPGIQAWIAFKGRLLADIYSDRVELGYSEANRPKIFLSDPKFFSKFEVFLKSIIDSEDWK